MFCRPLEASSVIQVVTALLNRLLQEVCSETLGRGQLSVCEEMSQAASVENYVKFCDM